MHSPAVFRTLNPHQRNAFLASFLGWTMDAMDYFILVFVLSDVGKDFHAGKEQMAWAITVTLAMRPLGALIFGAAADRFGRRIPLMVDIGLYSVAELLTAFAPNLTVFIVLRGLFGIAMGGEWGVGAALAMETLPAGARGFFSGLLQEGYVAGFFLASVINWVVLPHFGWRGMFIVGVLPAILIVFIRMGVPESPAFAAGEFARIGQSGGGLVQTLRTHWKLAAYAVVLMTAFNSMSHGSQDLYVRFLQDQHGFSPALRSQVVMFMNVGAFIGGLVIAGYSQKIGRRRAIVIAALLGLVMIYPWAWSTTIPTLAIGAFLLQFCVQGAWGVIPAHLNELSPAAIRGTFPGLVYQLGNLFAALTPVVIERLRAGHLTPSGAPSYSTSFTIFMAVAFAAVALLTALGKEARDVDMTADGAGSEPRPVTRGTLPEAPYGASAR